MIVIRLDGRIVDARWDSFALAIAWLDASCPIVADVVELIDLTTNRVHSFKGGDFHV
jgi:hypothetical protein